MNKLTALKIRLVCLKIKENSNFHYNLTNSICFQHFTLCKQLSNVSMQTHLSVIKNQFSFPKPLLARF